MTELLTRPPVSDVGGAQAGRPEAVWWRGCLAAVWAAAVGIAVLVVLALLVWATDSRSGAGAGGAVRVALQVWLAAHKVPLAVHGGTVALAPLGLTLALGFVVARAGAVLARARDALTTADLAVTALAVGVPYGVLTAFVAAAAHTGAVRPSPLGALLAGLIVGITAAGWGAVRGTDSAGLLAARVPEWAVDGARAGAIAVGVVVAAGMFLALASMTVHARAAASMADGLGGGVVAQAALLVLDALLIPNAAVAAAAYVAGPGFAVGAGTSVSLGGAHVGTMPSLPLLAAVPHGPAPTMVRILAVIVLIAAGAAAGWFCWRGGEGARGAVAARIAATAGTAGVLAAGLCLLAGGPAGGGRMAVVGASAWQTGLLVAAEITFVAVLVVVPLSWRARSR